MRKLRQASNSRRDLRVYGLLLVGVVIGWILGSRAAQDAQAAADARMKRRSRQSSSD